MHPDVISFNLAKRILLLTLWLGCSCSLGLAAGLFDANLIVNAGAEAGSGSVSSTDVLPVPGWTTTGNFTVSVYGDASSIPTNIPGPPNRGTNLFTGGPNTALSSAWQTTNVSAAAAQIDAGQVYAELTGYLGGWSSQDDNAVLEADLLDGTGTNTLRRLVIGPVYAVDRGNNTALLFRGATNAVPIGTRQVKLVLTMTRVSGSYDDGYADELSLVFRTLPQLAIAHDAQGARVSWPTNCQGFALESAAFLTPAPQWARVTNPPSISGGIWAVTNSLNSSQRFFRLRLQ